MWKDFLRHFEDTVNRFMYSEYKFILLKQQISFRVSKLPDSLTLEHELFSSKGVAYWGPSVHQSYKI